ncbi:MAG: DUF2961 domain-containing protein [Pirellulales bacterium]|nr:DUF2961 domain-containing protein [Pirellulales bacterium]
MNRFTPRILFALGCFAFFIFGQSLVDAQGPMDDLAKPMDGRSMRATSNFRGNVDGKRKIARDAQGRPRKDKNGNVITRIIYDPKADYLSHPTDENSNIDNFNVDPGATHVLMEADGPGVITHMWFTFLGPEPHMWAEKGAANHQEMLLRIYYDGNPRPGVEAPLGDFFANCFGKRREVISLPVCVEDADSYNCFWRMPFRKSIRIEVTNESEKQIRLLYYNIDWIKKDHISEDTPYFYAQYKQEYPVEQDKDYVVLETEGKGQYVGTVLAVRTRSPAWFGEGDEKIYIDGEQKPSIWGTGTEDYFLSAFGLKECSTPFFGVPYFDQWGIVGGHTSTYRWHISDPIVFNKSIKFTIEHYGWMSEDENPQGVRNSWNQRQDDYSSVAFWYQTGTPTFTARAPHARQRKLPNLDRVIVLAKDFLDQPHHGPGKADPQLLGQLYPGPQMLYRPASAEDAWVKMPVEVKDKEPLRLLVNATRTPDSGIYQAYLDDVAVGKPIDLYHEKINNFEYHLLDFWPEPGAYTFALKCVGKNDRSTGFNLGLESVRLRERRPRVMQYGHDKDKDWRKNPTVFEDD